jgi:hypothetical protein
MAVNPEYLKYDVVVEVGEDGDVIRYSRKAVADVEEMVKAVGAEASPDLLYCHACGATFKTQTELDQHKLGE